METQDRRDSERHMVCRLGSNSFPMRCFDNRSDPTLGSLLRQDPIGTNDET